MSTYKISKIVLIVFCLLLFPVLSSAQSSDYLFEDFFYSGKKPADPGPEVIREKYVKLNFDALLNNSSEDISADNLSGQLILNLFSDIELIAQLDYVEKNKSGSLSWIGKIQGEEYNSVILTVNGDIMMGTISIANENYTIHGIGDRIHLIREIDQSKYPECDGAIRNPESEDEEDKIGNDNGSIIDIMIVYTKSARIGVGGTTAMETKIDTYVAEMNTGFGNSGITPRVNLVHTAEVNYNEAPFSSSDTLYNLRNTSDGYMDNVHILRDSYGADLVHLIHNGDGCGIGFVSSSASDAFSTSHHTCAFGNKTMAHEMGHNIGCAHDRANYSVAGFYSYSFGYQAPDGAFRTIMAYSSGCPEPGTCPRINYWSNPDKNYGGQPTGVAEGEPDSADNRKTINNRANTVANFRQHKTSLPSKPTVTTQSVTNINSTTATGNGKITSLGTTNPTAHGVCWSTSSTPTISNTHTDEGAVSATGAFSSSMTGLNKSTKYYVRAYATNTAGTSYGIQKSFTTTATSTGSVPTVTTQAVTLIDMNTATGNGNIADLGSSDPTAHGVCWGTSSTPTVSGNHTDEGGASSTGAFTSKITGLSSNTKYYVRAYATNSTGTAYGNAVNFTSESLPALSLNRINFNFASMGTLITKSQQFIASNTGGGTLDWAAASNASWLTPDPASGTGDAIITISVDPSGLAAGNYSGIITVTDKNALNSPKKVAVSLIVKNNGTNTPPSGSFDTPEHGSAVSSSIAVTGWVIDDIETVSVKIYRLSNNTSVYIGDAVFVDDARSDIEAANPSLPLNYRAGWGYMLLTNFLPNGGNGTYTLQAIARDKEDNSVVLGSKTITCNNTDAIKPFGAIDTPTQGGTASGKNFINWGWALTPQPNSIKTDGSTLKVFVDSVHVGNPVYNIYRSDIATLFPSYANSNGAVGYFYLDTTSYENGVHTIQWQATDSAGNRDGIGSRYFSIINTSSDKRSSTNNKRSRELSIKELKNFEIDNNPIEITKGFNNKRQTTNDKRLKIRELERIVLTINPDNKNNTYSGYLKTGKLLKKLPIGSSLKNGKFYWSPGPGFLGTYDLVFINQENKTRKNIRIIIKPAQSE